MPTRKCTIEAGYALPESQVQSSNNGFDATLVAFGNYLLSDERKNKTSDLNQKNVTDADLRNFEYEMSILPASKIEEWINQAITKVHQGLEGKIDGDTSNNKWKIYSYKVDSYYQDKDGSWVIENEPKMRQVFPEKPLPSAHQIGDQVNVDLPTTGGTYFNGHVTKVSFVRGKVLYDVAVKFIDEQVEKSEAGPDIDEAVTTVETKITREKSVRLYNLDSVYVNKSIIKGDKPYHHTEISINDLANDLGVPTPPDTMEERSAIKAKIHALVVKGILAIDPEEQNALGYQVAELKNQLEALGEKDEEYMSVLRAMVRPASDVRVYVRESDITDTQRNIAEQTKASDYQGHSRTEFIDQMKSSFRSMLGDNRLGN